MIPVLQNGALKWKRKVTGIRSRAVTSDHTLKLKLRGKTPTEIHNALHEVCGDSVVDRSTVSRWASRFRGKRFNSIEEVSNEVTRVIRHINKEGVLTGIQDLPKRWTAVIKHNGDYIEGL